LSAADAAGGDDGKLPLPLISLAQICANRTLLSGSFLMPDGRIAAN